MYILYIDRFGRSGMAQYARSEAELEQIMDGLHEQEVERNRNKLKTNKITSVSKVPTKLSCILKEKKGF